MPAACGSSCRPPYSGAPASPSPWRPPPEPERTRAASSGGVYAANTLGAILGALLFSLVVVPAVGTQTAQRLLIGLAAASAVLAFAIAEPTRRSEPVGSGTIPRRWGSLAAAGAVLAVAALLVAGLAPLPWGLVAYGRFLPTYTTRLAPGIVSEEEAVKNADSADIFCTYLGEGLNGTIAVTRWSSGVRNFHSAGKVQASNDPRDMRLQRMLGHLSALAHGNPESVLVVACGAGVTAGSFVPHPETKRIVICDIEPLVPKEVAPRFATENFHVTTDPRTRVVRSASSGRRPQRVERTNDLKRPPLGWSPAAARPDQPSPTIRPIRSASARSCRQPGCGFPVTKMSALLSLTSRVIPAVVRESLHRERPAGGSRRR